MLIHMLLPLESHKEKEDRIQNLTPTLNMGWIDVEDSLPKITDKSDENFHLSESVIIYTKNKHYFLANFVYYVAGEYKGNKEWWPDSNGPYLLLLNQVTHWMPLPEPPGEI